MTKLLATLTAIAALAVVPSAASAAEPTAPTAAPSANGIIAILIGLAVQPFTPPIGSNKGS
jgi:hypothetical protein